MKKGKSRQGDHKFKAHMGYTVRQNKGRNVLFTISTSQHLSGSHILGVKMGSSAFNSSSPHYSSRSSPGWGGASKNNKAC